jgi:mono/diheme cytochrome c family protein|tara:strand:- start:1473 stop:2267 length:795 start_codon:yes stop_codon:yes gene_type:complete
LIDVFDDEDNLLRQQLWRYPARSECIQCHTPQGGFAAGFNTVQLNRSHNYSSGELNQITALSDVGYLNEAAPDPSELLGLVDVNDPESSLEDRVRSYLQANCVSCHQPGGTAQSLWDARISTSLNDAGILGGALLNDFGHAGNRVVAAGDLDRSMLLQRIATRGEGQMPPLGSSQLDEEGIELLSEWILGLSNGARARLESVGEDQVSIRIYGQPNTAYSVEQSIDLLEWEILGQAITDTNGEALFESTLVEDIASRFFRIQTP